MNFNCLKQLYERLGLLNYPENESPGTWKTLHCGSGAMEEAYFSRMCGYGVSAIDLPNQMASVISHLQETNSRQGSPMIFDTLIGKDLFDLTAEDIESIDFTKVKLISILIGHNLLYAWLLNLFPLDSLPVGASILFLVDVQPYKCELLRNADSRAYRLCCSEEESDEVNTIALPKVILDYLEIKGFKIWIYSYKLHNSQGLRRTMCIAIKINEGVSSTTATNYVYPSPQLVKLFNQQQRRSGIIYLTNEIEKISERVGYLDHKFDQVVRSSFTDAMNVVETSNINIDIVCICFSDTFLNWDIVKEAKTKKKFILISQFIYDSLTLNEVTKLLQWQNNGDCDWYPQPINYFFPGGTKGGMLLIPNFKMKLKFVRKGYKKEMELSDAVESQPIQMPKRGDTVNKEKRKIKPLKKPVNNPCTKKQIVNMKKVAKTLVFGGTTFKSLYYKKKAPIIFKDAVNFIDLTKCDSSSSSSNDRIMIVSMTEGQYKRNKKNFQL